MQKAVLPCSMDGSRPFVAPDGSLPCPALSTYNALRYLQGHPEAMAKAEARAKAQREKIFTKGVQVECGDFQRAGVSAGAATHCSHSSEVFVVLQQRSGIGR